MYARAKRTGKGTPLPIPCAKGTNGSVHGSETEEHASSGTESEERGYASDSDEHVKRD